MATYSSTVAGKTPWTEEPGRLQSRGPKELGMTEQLNGSDSIKALFSLES